MPGLLRGMARVAVVSGTATAVSNRVSRRQASNWAEQGETSPAYLGGSPQAAPPPAPPRSLPAPTRSSSSRSWASCTRRAILTDEEFAAQKAKLLA